MELKVGAVCDRGLNPRRPVNQDRFLAIVERGLFAVFDGVGGQRAGEIASQTAAETIEEALTHDSAGSSQELVRRAIQFANRDIFEMAEGDAALKTMATTIALLHIEGDRATIAHVGDSRVYRLENGRFYRETIDHTDFNDDLRAGRISNNKAAEAAQRNVINRALGVESDVEVESKSIALHDGSRFLLCSDGIYRHLSDEEIARVLAENKDPQRAADELKRIVHERGADDNLTAVVVQVGRARQSAVLSIEDGMSSYNREPDTARVAEAAAGRTPSRGGRIQVEVSRKGQGGDLTDESTRRLDRAHSQVEVALEKESKPQAASHKLVWVLVVMTLMAAAFYAGLRAPELFSKEKPLANEPNAVRDPVRVAREAFDRGEYHAAMSEFNGIVSREPQNATAHYWLGRAQLETGDHNSAAQAFEAAIRIEPSMRDAYLQAAVAYEAAGNRVKAAQMLALYNEKRRERSNTTGATNVNSQPR